MELIQSIVNEAENIVDSLGRSREKLSLPAILSLQESCLTKTRVLLPSSLELYRLHFSALTIQKCLRGLAGVYYKFQVYFPPTKHRKTSRYSSSWQIFGRITSPISTSSELLLGLTMPRTQHRIILISLLRRTFHSDSLFPRTTAPWNKTFRGSVPYSFNLNHFNSRSSSLY